MAGIFFAGQKVNFGNNSNNITISSDTSWTANNTYAYNDVIVSAGKTLSISRTAITQISGTLTVYGTITALDSINGGNAGSAGNFDGDQASGGGGGGGSTSGWSGDPADVGGGGGGAAYGNNTAGITYYSDTIPSAYSGGAGGKGGSTTNTGGGGGGYGNGSFKIIAKNIIIKTNGKIHSDGGGGGQGGGGSSGGNYPNGEGSGGGGGGGGGTIVLFSTSLLVESSGSLTALGGTGGDGGSGDGFQGRHYGSKGGNGSVGRILGVIGTTNNSGTISPSFNYLSGSTYIYDSTPPTISLSKSVEIAGPYQNQQITATITDSQSSINTPTYSLSNAGTSATVSRTWPSATNTATFLISNQSGNGTATLTVTASDAADNVASQSISWNVSSLNPSGFTSFFGESTTDWNIDGSSLPDGILQYSGNYYYVRDCWNETGSYSISLRNLTIASGYVLLWKGVLTIKVNNLCTINGILGWGTKNQNPLVYGNTTAGGGTGGARQGGTGWGYSSTGVYGAYGGSGGGNTSENYGSGGGGGGGSHLYKVPSASDNRTAVINRGISIGNGGGGGGRGSFSTGGFGGGGGAGLILYAQEITGTGTIDVSGSWGTESEAAKGDDNENTNNQGGGAGGGSGGHAVVIAGTANFSNGKIYASGGQGAPGVSWTTKWPRPAGSSGAGSAGGDGYINFYYNAGTLPATVSPAIINTTKQDTSIPATQGSVAPAADSASITSPYRKEGQVQTISISYNKTMTPSEVKISIKKDGTEVLAATAMTNSSGNNYSYAYTNPSGNGVMTYKIVAKDNAMNPSADISGSWILDNAKPSFELTLSPNKNVFVVGEKITYTLKATEDNVINEMPSFSLAPGSFYSGQSVPSAQITLSSINGSVYTYTTTAQIPFAIGNISSSFSGTDLTGNSESKTGQSQITILPPSGIIQSM